MADRDRFGGSDRDYGGGIGSFSPWPDRRMPQQDFGPGGVGGQRGVRKGLERMPQPDFGPPLDFPDYGDRRPQGPIPDFGDRRPPYGIPSPEWLEKIIESRQPPASDQDALEVLANMDFQGTTVPEGREQPDRFGRMRPTLPNPYEGATIGGGWDDYGDRYSAEDRYRDYMRRGEDAFGGEFPEDRYSDYMQEQYDDLFGGGGGQMSAIDQPSGIETAGLWQTWQKIRDRLGEDAANEWLLEAQA